MERLLKEVDEKGLSTTNRFEPEFNPINFLAQYLMRNNPRYSNFAEASPYVRGLRQVSEELKQELFTFEDNRFVCSIVQLETDFHFLCHKYYVSFYLEFQDHSRDYL